MNLTQLKYFQAISTFGSVSAAADSLYISQPSLSNAIRDLEKEFGIVLFKRHHRGMVLTREGEELLKLTEELLSQAQQLERFVSDLGNKQKILRLGIPPMIGSLILPKIYRDFVPQHSDIRLDITEAGRNELSSLLSKDLLDIVILPHNIPLDTSLVSQKIAQLEIVCCAAEGQSIAGLKEVTPTDLEDIPIVLFKNSFFQTAEIKKWFAMNKITPNVLLQTNQFSTLKNLISNNIAVGFLFRRLIDENENLAAIPMSPPLFIDVSLVYKRSTHIFSAMKSFLEYMSSLNNQH